MSFCLCVIRIKTYRPHSKNAALPATAACPLDTVPQGYKDQNDLCIFACFTLAAWCGRDMFY